MAYIVCDDGSVYEKTNIVYADYDIRPEYRLAPDHALGEWQGNRHGIILRSVAFRAAPTPQPPSRIPYSTVTLHPNLAAAPAACGDCGGLNAYGAPANRPNDGFRCGSCRSVLGP